MKTFLLATVAAFWTFASSGQAQVNFSNASSTPGWDPVRDRHVYFPNNTALLPPGTLAGAPVSSNHNGLNFSALRAALYYAPTTVTDIHQFLPASGGPATFRVSTSTVAGSWFGGFRTLDSIPPGTTANMLVLIWDSSLSSNPLSPAAQAGLWAQSFMFQYTSPTSPTQAGAELLMNNLVGFSWVPEPSTFALVSLGAVTWVLLRRRAKV